MGQLCPDPLFDRLCQGFRIAQKAGHGSNGFSSEDVQPNVSGYNVGQGAQRRTSGWGEGKGGGRGARIGGAVDVLDGEAPEGDVQLLAQALPHRRRQQGRHLVFQLIPLHGGPHHRAACMPLSTLGGRHTS